MFNNTTIDEGYGLDDIIIGSSYVILSVFSAFLYIPCLIVMYTDEELRKHSCLRVMFHLGISDMLHLFGEIICGFWSLTGYSYTIPRWLNNLVINLTCNLGWNSYIILANLLSFNRCVSLTLNRYWNSKLFGPKSTTVWLTFCWFWASLWIIFNFSPWGGIIYHASRWVYYFDKDAPLFKIHKVAVLCNCIVHQVCIWIFNIISIVNMRITVSKMGNISRAKSKEMSLLKQSVIICLVLLIMDQYWHNLDKWTCPFVGIYCYPLGSYLLIINSIINPILYLTINKTIKRKVFQMLFNKDTSRNTFKRSKKETTVSEQNRQPEINLVK